jgi:hypothetical protein
LAAALSPAMAMGNGQNPYIKGYRDFMNGVPRGVQIRTEVMLTAAMNIRRFHRAIGVPLLRSEIRLGKFPAPE